MTSSLYANVRQVADALFRTQWDRNGPSQFASTAQEADTM